MTSYTRADALKAKDALDMTNKLVRKGDLLHFHSEEPWDNMGYVNGDMLWPYVPVWTERKNGKEATTLMVHVNNITAINRETVNAKRVD